VLDVAVQIAKTLGMPTAVIDGTGDLIYFNPPAERMIGRAFADVGELPISTWVDTFDPESLDGKPLSLPELPPGVALIEGRPAQGSVRMCGLDGVEHLVAVTALPLFEDVDLVGVLIVFWETMADPDMTPPPDPT
jgi:PAS domain-containing protein